MSDNVIIDFSSLAKELNAQILEAEKRLAFLRGQLSGVECAAEVARRQLQAPIMTEGEYANEGAQP